MSGKVDEIREVLQMPAEADGWKTKIRLMSLQGLEIVNLIEITENQFSFDDAFVKAKLSDKSCASEPDCVTAILTIN